MIIHAKKSDIPPKLLDQNLIWLKNDFTIFDPTFSLRTTCKALIVV
jgi:hypothetical protein